jgi:uncharacterized protein
VRQTPCEIILWNRLPAIRKELAIALIENHGLNQRDAAAKLGITPAAVCQYLSKKRGQAIIFNNAMQAEIAIAAANIANDGSIMEETCRLCHFLRDQDPILNPEAAPPAPRSRRARP